MSNFNSIIPTTIPTQQIPFHYKLWVIIISNKSFIKSSDVMYVTVYNLLHNFPDILSTQQHA